MAWVVQDAEGLIVGPVAEFLRDFAARGNSAGSVRSYAYVLLRWWRWLAAVGVDWDRATAAEVRDLVLWLQLHPKPRRSARTLSADLVGTVNPKTGKQYLDDHYAARTIRHNNAALASFYEYWAEQGRGPVMNPVLRAGGGRRPNAHHNPMMPFRPEGKLRYNPKVPRRRPRALTDEAWDELFDTLTCHRDRALLALTVSNGARASEVLGIRGADVDWGNQLVRVIRKGSRAQQWLPVSEPAMVWLRLYLAEVGKIGPGDPVWVTVRRRQRQGTLTRVPMTYEALRAVLQVVAQHRSRIGQVRAVAGQDPRHRARPTEGFQPLQRGEVCRELTIGPGHDGRAAPEDRVAREDGALGRQEEAHRITRMPRRGDDH